MGFPGPLAPGARRIRPRSLGLALTSLLAACVAATPPATSAEPASATPPARSAESASARPLATSAEPALAALISASEERGWLALLHRARTRLDGATREALHDSGFFLHSEGDRDPALELEATVAAMTASDAAAAQAARCRWPARFAYLAERGLVPTERGSCPKLEAWRAEIGQAQVTLIFPEAFLGNPSSMFGHTLLRFDPIVDADGPEEDTPLLGWALDFTADPGDDAGPLYLLRGLAGGYRGRFGIAPYYQKARYYSDWQDRDIWEYPLALSPAEVDRVLLHVWEMEDVELPYFFFTQNCSKYLLDVLEITWPGLGRGGGFPPTVTPIDTVRAMVERDADSVGTPRFRPSPATRLQVALGELDAGAAALVEALAEGEADPQADALLALDESRRARLLEIAYDLTYHRTTARALPSDDTKERLRALLVARSRLPRAAAKAPTRLAPDRPDPLSGHRTARVSTAGGIHDRDGFVELRLQPSFHESMDAPGGFAEGGEIKFLDTAIRYYPERVRLHEFVVLDVTTASPWRRPFRPLGWHTEIGLRTRMVSRGDVGRGLEPDSFFRAQGGFGAAIAPAPRLHLYAFGEAVVEAADAIEGDAAAGPLVRLGASWSTPRGGLTLHAEAIGGGLFGRDTSEWLRLELTQRITLGGDWSLQLGGHFERAYDVGHFEGRAGLIRYF